MYFVFFDSFILCVFNFAMFVLKVPQRVPDGKACRFFLGDIFRENLSYLLLQKFQNRSMCF